MKSRVIVSAIIKKDGKILLGRKPDNLGPYPNAWHLPGGGVNLDDESVEDALRREVKEETGLNIKNLKQVSFDEDYEPDKHSQLTHYIFLVYEVDYASGSIKANDDLERLDWFEKDKLSEIPLTRPSIKLFKQLGWF